MVTWLGVYCAATPGVDYSDNATVRLDGNNEVQPDALLRRDPADGGKSRVSHDDYIEGPPELVIEIAKSSSDYDYNRKWLIYQQCGVQEYLLWRVQMQTIDWWELHHGSYRQRAANAEGIITSGVFPGLRLHTRALLAGDFAAVLATQQSTRTSTLPGDPPV
jgi:Uma2 family endonuclease